MSPRSRTISDDSILTSAAHIIGKVGPGRLTLVDVATDAGVAPATLLQRFGSKRGLLLALVRQGNSSVGEEFERARARHTSSLDALVDALSGLARHAGTPEELSNHLAFLQIDLTDSEFHDAAVQHARTVAHEIEECLIEAQRSAEIAPSDTARLARSLQVMYNGSLVTWAIYRQGTAIEWLRDDLEMALSPYRI